MPGEVLFRTQEGAEAHLREALWVGDDGHEGDDGDDKGDEGDEGGDKGEGADKGGEVLGDKGGEREGDMGVEKGGCREQGCAPATSHHAGGVTCVSQLAGGGLGGQGG